MPNNQKSTQIILQARNLTYERNDNELFCDLNFSLRAGEMLQVKGANGSGKTSLLRLLCQLSLPEEGTFFWYGEELKHVIHQYLREVIYIGHNQGVKNELTVRENLNIFNALSEQPTKTPISQVIEIFGLAEHEDSILHRLSAGQKRRVALARLLLHEKKLWILDEPQTALDRIGLSLLENLYQQHIHQGGMIIIATHQPINAVGINIKSLLIGESDPQAAVCE